ncbi:uncharacterized protein LOC118204708 isoform X3 [Stegodyphus dumicola]|uniref:uncharacterized protein LOC118204708 isoform X3 n=1 Tax=Stegodyphus dumicola TaxID=202533 RepID=UPI0015A91061|nr:uncharacterized protein LOC118204708 isoform X3 [Stegodyphus dumicola]
MKIAIVNKLIFSASIFLYFLCRLTVSGLEDGVGNMSEEEVGSCWYAITCKLGEEAHKKSMSCSETVSENELLKAFEWYKEFDPPITYKSENVDDRMRQLCESDPQTQDRYFQFFIQRFIDMMSDYCYNPLKQDLCKRWTLVKDCSEALIVEYYSRKECVNL